MKVAIITGASRGFGREIAKALVNEGWTVVIDARDASALEAAATELRELAGSPERVRAIHHARDVS